MRAKISKHSKKNVWKTFDQISRFYDFLNRVLSFGIDVYWRKRLVEFLPKNPDVRLLDLATGTGDQIIEVIKKAKQVKSALGIDLSQEMIRIGQRKIIDKPYTHQVSLMEGDAMDIAMKDESVECVTMSFGIRNVEHVETCLSECLRVLTPRGRLLILEFSMPKNRLLRKCHLFYLRYILPTVGGLISKNKTAYRYLSKTIERFPYGENFCALMRKVGFVRVKSYPMTFGVTTLYIGEKVPCQNEI